MRPNPFPPLKPCHNCGLPYAGAICHVCKTERPEYTRLKSILLDGVPAQQVVKAAGEVC